MAEKKINYLDDNSGYDDPNKKKITTDIKLKDPSILLTPTESAGYSTMSGYGNFGKSKYDTPLTSDYFETQEGDSKPAFEYVRGARQSHWDKAANGIIRAAGAAAQTLYDGTAGIGYGIIRYSSDLALDELNKKKYIAEHGSLEGYKPPTWTTIFDNDATRAGENLIKGLEDVMPLYGTKDYENASGLEKLKYMNFWTDDVLKGIGTTVGSMPLGIGGSKLFNAIGKNFAAGKLASGVKTALSGTENLEKVLIDQAKKIKLYNAGDKLVASTFAAVGEAGMEARGAGDRLREELLAQITQNGTREATQGELDWLEQVVDDAKKSAFGANMAIITGTDFLTFGKYMTSNKSAKYLDDLEKTSSKLNVNAGSKVTKTPIDGSKLAADYAATEYSKGYKIARAAYNASKRVLGTNVGQGVEENLQTFAEHGVVDFGKLKYYGKQDAEAYLHALGAAYEGATSSEGVEAFLAGFISGGISNTILSKGQNIKEVFAKDPVVNNALKEINLYNSQSVMGELIKSVAEQQAAGSRMDNAKNDTFRFNNAQSDLATSYVLSRIKTNKFEDLQSDLDELKTMPAEEVEKLFGVKIGEGGKNSVIDFIQGKMDQAKQIKQIHDASYVVFPEGTVSDNNRDRLIHANVSILDTQKRIKSINEDFQKKGHESIKTSFVDGASTINLESFYRADGTIVNYNLLEGKERTKIKAEIIERLNNTSVAPIEIPGMITLLDDLDKLKVRHAAYKDIYNSLLNPVEAEKLDKEDAIVEKQIVQEDAAKKLAEEKPVVSEPVQSKSAALDAAQKEATENGNIDVNTEDFTDPNITKANAIIDKIGESQIDNPMFDASGNFNPEAEDPSKKTYDNSKKPLTVDKEVLSGKDTFNKISLSSRDLKNFKADKFTKALSNIFRLPKSEWNKYIKLDLTNFWSTRNVAANKINPSNNSNSPFNSKSNQDIDTKITIIDPTTGEIVDDLHYIKYHDMLTPKQEMVIGNKTYKPGDSIEIDQLTYEDAVKLFAIDQDTELTEEEFEAYKISYKEIKDLRKALALYYESTKKKDEESISAPSKMYDIAPLWTLDYIQDGAVEYPAISTIEGAKDADGKYVIYQGGTVQKFLIGTDTKVGDINTVPSGSGVYMQVTLPDSSKKWMPIKSAKVKPATKVWERIQNAALALSKVPQGNKEEAYQVIKDLSLYASGKGKLDFSYGWNSDLKKYTLRFNIGNGLETPKSIDLSEGVSKTDKTTMLDKDIDFLINRINHYASKKKLSAITKDSFREDTPIEPSNKPIVDNFVASATGFTPTNIKIYPADLAVKEAPVVLSTAKKTTSNVVLTDLSYTKKADIERRRQEELNKIATDIFPNTTHTDIVYRGVGEIRDDNFRDSTSNDIRDWNFFTDNKDKALDYGENVISAIINFSEVDDSKSINYKGSSSFKSEDSAFVAGQGGDEFAVKNKEQIHILSKEEQNKINKINAKYDAELAALESTKSTPAQQVSDVFDDQEAISEAITNISVPGSTIIADKNINQPVNTPDGKSIASVSNVAMMKLAEGGVNPGTKNFSFRHDAKGDVILTGSSVTMEVNDPKVATAGSEVEFRIVTLNEAEQKSADESIEYSRRQIDSNMKHGNPYGYTNEDLAFNSPEYTTPIGIYQDGKLIGYVQIPHWINENKDTKVDPLLYAEVRKSVIAERKAILQKLKDGPVKTTIVSKGSGNMVSRVINNKSEVRGNLLKEMRPEDRFAGNAVFAYVGLSEKFIIPTSNEKLKEAYDDINNRDAFGTKGTLYQVVKNANGSNSVIPVYSSLINDVAASKIIEAIKNLPENPEYKEVIAALHRYIYVSNKKDTRASLKYKSEDKLFVIDGQEYSLESLRQNPAAQERFKGSLKTKYHNIHRDYLNSSNYQKYLSENNVLQTNAYTINGQYFIQPYIEYKSIIDKNKTSTETKEEIKEQALNTNSTLEQANKNLENKKFDRNDFGFSRKRQVSTLDRNAVRTFLSKYTPWLTLSDIEEVSKVKGVIKDAVGAFRNRVIYLFEGASTKTGYHEAFHGVFRNMLTFDEAEQIYNEAAKIYGKPSAQDIASLREEFPTDAFNGLKDEEITSYLYDRWLEEKMADDFSEFANNFTEKSSWNKIKDFFKRILQWFNILKVTPKNKVELLFENIMARKYAKSKPIIYKDNKYYSYSRANIGNLPVHIKDERVNAITSRFLAKYGVALRTDNKVDSKKILQSILKEYVDSYHKESIKDEENINVPVINTLREVIENWAAINEEVAELAKVKLKLNVTTLSTEDAQKVVDAFSEEVDEAITSEDFGDEEVNIEGNTTKGFGELTTKSGIDSASRRIKLLFSSIPVLKDGVVQKDRFGFPVYHSYEKIYYAVERNLVGLKTIEEMQEALEKASIFRPELASVKEMISTPIGAGTKGFEKLQNDFLSNFRKQLMQYYLVLYTKAGDNDYEYKFVNSNREGVALEIYHSWINNLNQQNGEVITDFSKDIPQVNATEKAIDLYNQFTNKKASLTVSELRKMLTKVGVIYSEGTLEKAFDTKRENILTASEKVFKYYATSKDNVDINSIERDGRKALGDLVKYELAGNLNNYTTSLNNVEGKAVYPIQNPSWISDIESSIKSSNSEGLYQELKRDPILQYSNLVNDLWQEDSSEFFRNDQFKILYLNGLKNSRGELQGAKFTKMVKEDWLLTQLTLFQNNVTEQNLIKTPTAIYTNITPSDKTLEVLWEGRKYSSYLDKGTISPKSEIINKYYNIVLGEANRIKQALDDKRRTELPIEHPEYLPKEQLLKYYHFNGDNNTAFNGAAYRFNFLDINDKKLNKQSTGESVNLIDVVKERLETMSVEEAINPMEKNIRALIVDQLTKSYKESLRRALDSGMIVKREIDGKTYFAPQTLQVPLKTTDTGSKIERNDEEKDAYIKDLFRNFSTNAYLANIEFSLLMNGDPAYYKSTKGVPSDMPKRFYQAQSMVIRINEKLIPNLKTSVIADYKTNADTESSKLLDKHAPDSKEYYSNEKGNSTNVTDAQVWVTPEVYKKLKEARGIWTEEDEKAHRIAEGLEKPDMGDTSWQNRLNAIKPFGYGNIYNEKLGRYTPIQLKCSIMPLYDSFIVDNPLLKEHKAKMLKDGIDMLATESSLKALMPQVTELSDTKGSYSTIDIPTNIFGFQVDNPDHMVDADNSSTRQLKMIIPGNIDPLLDYDGRSGQDIINELNTLEAANVHGDLEKTLNRTKTAEFNEYLQEALTSRKATNVTKKILEVDANGKFAYPLNLINTTTIENMISSVFTKRVIKQEFKNGGSAVQASSVGFKFNSEYRNITEQQKAVEKNPDLKKAQSSLKWIRAKDANSIDYIECAMPAWTKKFFDKDGKLLKDIPDELLRLIPYRIPTEGFHSAMSIKVVKFLPPEMGNFMLLPEQVTTQFGADFDFDKTFFIGPEFYKKGNRLIKINYLDNNNSTLDERYTRYILREFKTQIKAIKEEFNIDETYEKEELLSEKAFINDIIGILTDEGTIPTKEAFSEFPLEYQNSKAARNTRIYENYDTILRSNHTLPYLVKPSGFDEIKEISDSIIKKQGISEKLNYYDNSTQNDYKDLFHAVIGLKGQIANHVTGHSFMRMMNLSVNDKFVIRFNREKDSKKYKVYDNLSGLKSENGGLISEEEATMMAGVLDAVKNPDMLPALGINDQSIDIWATLVHLGLGVKNASLYTAQPAIKELTNALRSNFKQVKQKGFEPIKVEDIILKYTKELEAELEKIQDLGKVERFKNDSLGLKGVYESYSALETKDLEKYVAFNDTNPEARIWHLAYQIRCLNTFNKIKPISDYILDLNRFFTVNKETGPNMENMADKIYLKQKLSRITENTPVLGFNPKAVPQLSAMYETHKAALVYLNREIPHMSKRYEAVKELIATYQYNGEILDISHKERNTINGFIKAFIDHSFSEFSTIDSLAERKSLFTNFASKIAQLKSLQEKDDKLTDYERENRRTLKDNAFINQLEVKFEDGLGFIRLKGNRLSDIEKNQVIAAGLALWKNPNTKELFGNLIKYSYLSSGFFTGLNSYHSLIDPSILDEFGKDENYVDFQRRMTLESKEELTLEEQDRLVDQLVRNFPKKFTSTYDQDIFAGFDTEGKPDTIYVHPEKARKVGMVVGENEDGTLIYEKYIRVYSKKYKGSLIYKWVEGDTFTKISYLGKGGSLIEINSTEDIEASIVKKNNYAYETEEAANTRVITNPFATTKEEKNTSKNNDDLFNQDQSSEANDDEIIAAFSDEFIPPSKPVEEKPIKKSGFIIDTPSGEDAFNDALNNIKNIDKDDKITPCE